LKYFGNPVDTLYEIALARIEWFELAQSSRDRRGDTAGRVQKESASGITANNHRYFSCWRS